MKRYILIIAVLAVVLSGCKTGVVVRHYYKAAGPVGELLLKKETDTQALGHKPTRSLSHELLAFDGEGLLVVAENKVVHIDYNALAIYRYRGKRRFFSRKDGSSAIQAHIKGMHGGGMAYLVRYPHGVSPKLMEALLEAYKQEEIIKISRNN